jgi:uncharacterized alpha/beta hydrolase family protein
MFRVIVFATVTIIMVMISGMIIYAKYEDYKTPEDKVPPIVQQAEAPASIIAKMVSDMPPGTQATVHPETLVIDDAKKVWLNKNHPIDEESPVIVHFLKDGSYEVEIADDKLRWVKVTLTEDQKKTLVPVKAVHLPKKKQ